MTSTTHPHEQNAEGVLLLHALEKLEERRLGPFPGASLLANA